MNLRALGAAPLTVAGLGKPIERAHVAAKIGFKVHMHAAKTIPPAVVASALRSSAGANKHESGAHRPSPHAGQTGVGSRVAELRAAAGHSVSTVVGANVRCSV